MFIQDFQTMLSLQGEPDKILHKYGMSTYYHASLSLSVTTTTPLFPLCLRPMTHLLQEDLFSAHSADQSYTKSRICDAYAIHMQGGGHSAVIEANHA